MQTINITVPKVGALFGEAVIITAEKAKRNFHYSIKRQGGMRA
jgi:threonine aldolase